MLSSLKDGEAAGNRYRRHDTVARPPHLSPMQVRHDPARLGHCDEEPPDHVPRRKHRRPHAPATVAALVRRSMIPKRNSPCFTPSIRYGTSPEPVTPYQRAAQVWDDRIGSARAQAKNWRLAFFGCLAISGGLAGGLVWQSARGSIVPWVVEVDKLGKPRLSPLPMPTSARLIRRSHFTLPALSNRCAGFPPIPSSFARTGFAPMTSSPTAARRRSMTMRETMIPSRWSARHRSLSMFQAWCVRLPTASGSAGASGITRMARLSRHRAGRRSSPPNPAAPHARCVTQKPARIVHQRHQLVEGAKPMTLSNSRDFRRNTLRSLLIISTVMSGSTAFAKPHPASIWQTACTSLPYRPRRSRSSQPCRNAIQDSRPVSRRVSPAPLRALRPPIGDPRAGLGAPMKRPGSSPNAAAISTPSSNMPMPKARSSRSIQRPDKSPTLSSRRARN